MAMPSGPTTTMLLGSACWFACSLIVLVCPLPDSGRAGGGPDPASVGARPAPGRRDWQDGGAHGLILAGLMAIPTVTEGLDSGIRCPTLGERRSSRPCRARHCPT